MSDNELKARHESISPRLFKFLSFSFLFFLFALHNISEPAEIHLETSLRSCRDP